MPRIRDLPLIALLLLAPLPVAHAVSPGTYVFSGIATQSCYGCGQSSGSFVGVLTGVVDGHAYVEAPLTMSYTTLDDPNICYLTAIANGTMHVSDGTASADWDFAWTRSYGVVVLATTNPFGTFLASYVAIDPVDPLCVQAAPVRFDMRGAGITAS